MPGAGLVLLDFSDFSANILIGRSEQNIYAWASCQIRKITCCACTGNAENVFPVTAG